MSRRISFYLYAGVRIIVISAFIFFSQVYGQNFFPDTGFAAISQRCRDVASNLAVLNISLRPGDEDFQTLSYLRMERGCKLLSVYVTNGELAECDSAELFPHELGAIYRKEATASFTLLESAVNFLNFPDIASYSSISDIYNIWPKDTVQLKLRRIIASYKPDVIFFTHSNSFVDSLLQQYVQECISDAVQSLRSLKSDSTNQREMNILPWNVVYVLVRSQDKSGWKVPVSNVNSNWRRSYKEIGDRISREYHSLSMYGKSNLSQENIFYVPINATGKQEKNFFGKGFTPKIPQSVQNMYNKISKLTNGILSHKNTPKQYGSSLSSILDSVDKMMLKLPETMSRERRLVIAWKENLEKLRAAIKGVTVGYSLDYSIATEKQVLVLQIDTVTNLPSTGKTNIVFPTVDRDWIVNESKQSALPLKFNEEYRLLSPAKITYDLPLELTYQDQPIIQRPLPVIVVHRAPKKEDNFIFRLTPQIQYSPRFTAEVLTPIVRCVDGEKLVVRLTNHSRDGVSDIVTVQDTLVQSNNIRVNLSGKEISSTDTLTLTWNHALRDSVYLIPVKYGGVTVTGFLGRKFEVNIDSMHSIALITGWNRSETSETLRRLGYRNVKNLGTAKLNETMLKDVQTVLIDRRAMTLRPFNNEERSLLDSYALQGGHIVIFEQDADLWNSKPFIENVQLVPTMKWTVNSGVRYDTTNILFCTPNKIIQADFQDWIVRRASHTIINTSEGSKVLLSSENGSPFIIENSLGKGKIVYCDLSLSPQFMNIHTGVYRFLANCISF